MTLWSLCRDHPLSIVCFLLLFSFIASFIASFIVSSVLSLSFEFYWPLYYFWILFPWLFMPWRLCWWLGFYILLLFSQPFVSTWFLLAASWSFCISLCGYSTFKKWLNKAKMVLWWILILKLQNIKKILTCFVQICKIVQVWVKADIAHSWQEADT